jgi:hypothetical protein
MPAISLEGRLLCASACAYAASAGESVLDPDAAIPYYDGAGFLQPPTAFLGGPEDIDACLVGTTADGVVAAFRGTLPLDGPFTLPKLLDWTNDLNAQPVPGDALPGRVHAGFLLSLEALWDRVRDETKRQLAQVGRAAPLLVTGHSKGGGVAPLAAMRLHMEEAITARVVTFAAPKCGDQEFADAYNAEVDHSRYEFGEDIVPHLPPSATLFSVLSALPFFGQRVAGLPRFDYARVGTLRYITRSLDVVEDPDDSLLEERRLRLLGLIVRGQLQEIGDDHRIACGYGYMTALCPSGVCPPPL